MTVVEDATDAVLASIGSHGRTWLFEQAFPLWAERGVDPAGGFHERLDLHGDPTGHDRRAFVQARQVYAYIEAGALGWQGPWDRLARHGLDYLMTAYARPDGAFAHRVSPSGRIVEAHADLYDQAFVLFALAHGYKALGEARYANAARAVLDFLDGACRHPAGGFHEAHDDRILLKQNPHMHLLEAALAWIEASGEARWWTLASGLVELALARFIDPATGGLMEYFGETWGPHPTRARAVVEPGHQFEWAWLLNQWARLGGAARPDVATRLYTIGETLGRDVTRGVVVQALDIEGRQTEREARIWAQTERLRAATMACRAAPPRLRAPFLATAVEAFQAIQVFLDTPTRGLWRDRWDADGSFTVDYSPASSLYHIVGAYSTLMIPVTR